MRRIKLVVAVLMCMAFIPVLAAPSLDGNSS